MERAIRFASRFNPADLDRDAIMKTKALPEGDKTETMLGVVMGKIRGVSFRNNPNDPTQASIALLGVFEGVPYNPQLPLIQAPMCFLPSSVHAILTAAITEANGLKLPDMAPARGKPENHRIDVEIPITFEIGVRRTATPIGFEFITNQLRKSVETENVLADLREELAKAGKLKLPPPSEQRPAPLTLPAPETDKPARERKGGSKSRGRR